MSAPSAPYEGLGRPIRGPRALSSDWRRFWHLTYNIARNEFKLRFFGSALGYLWQLVRPLLLFGVLYVFFTKVAKVNNSHLPGQQHYGAQLLGSIVLFTFFGEATSGAVRSVVDRENLVRKIQFPRMVIPLSVVLLALFNLALNLVVVLGFALAEGVTPTLSWLELPLIVLMLAAFSTGIAMLLSALFVSLRDIQPIWDVVSQVLFYCSPVIISVETVKDKVSTDAAAPLHAQSARRGLPAVPPRDHHQRHPQRRSGDRQLGRAARAARARGGGVRARLLGLQPLGAAGSREPLAASRAQVAFVACSGVRGRRAGARPRSRAICVRAPCGERARALAPARRSPHGARHSDAAWSRSCSSTRRPQRG